METLTQAFSKVEICENGSQIKSHHTDRKVYPLNYQILKSHLAIFLFKILLILSCCALIIFVSFYNAKMPLVIPLITCTLLLSLIIKHGYSIRKKLLFDLSFIYTVKTGGNEWWTAITDQIILGGIPLKSHADRLIKNKVTHILTLLEPFELIPGLISPLSQKTIERLNIKNQIFVCQDFTGVSAETIHEAVEYLHTAISQVDQKIYVHCKAGRGRSATVVVAYLLKYGCAGKKFNQFIEAYAFVKNKRPRVNLNVHQQKTIEDYYLKYVLVKNH